jgi:succinate dehydrogenase (ubiquinone) membrane anchor subunit
MARNVNRVASPTLLVTRLANTIIHRSASNAAAAAAAGAHHHNHSKHWNKERLVGAFLLFIIPASVVLENQVTDFLLAATLAIHANWGMHGIFTDYIHGVSLPKICLRLLNVFSVIGFLGLCYFNYYDVGLGTAIKKVWAL